jgi:TonB family protein
MIKHSLVKTGQGLMLGVVLMTAMTAQAQQGIGGSPEEPVIFGTPVDLHTNVRHFDGPPPVVKELEPLPVQQQPVQVEAPPKPVEVPKAPQHVELEPVPDMAAPGPVMEQPASTEPPPEVKVLEPITPPEAIEVPPVEPPPAATESPREPVRGVNTEAQGAQSMYEAFCAKPVEEYKDRWMKQVNNWKVSRPTEKGTFLAIVKYAISKDGTVQNVQLAQSSGHTGVDTAAVNQIQSLDPEPLPECFRLPQIQFSHTFRLVNP